MNINKLNGLENSDLVLTDSLSSTALIFEVDNMKWAGREKEYMKEYNIKNRDKHNQCKKEWWQKNRERMLQMKKKYYHKNKEHILNKSREWHKNNPDKVREVQIKYNGKYPEKVKAWRYALWHKQRDDKCRDCGTIENLQFHHTNYEKNEGFTVCCKCHFEIHTNLAEKVLKNYKGHLEEFAPYCQEGGE